MLGTKFKGYPRYKDTNIDWIGAIPIEWETERICRIISSEQVGIWGEEKQNDENDIICIRVADFDYSNSGIKLSEEYTQRNILPKDRIKRLLQPYKSLLIEKSGGGELQPVGRIVLFNKNFNALSSNFIASFITKNICLTNFFLYLSSSFYSNGLNIKSIKQTTGIQNLDTRHYFYNKIPLPPLDEQREITNFLDKETERINTIISKQTRLIELLKEKRSALITHAVTKGLNPNAKLKSSGIAWIGDIPETWEVRKLKYLSYKIKTGTTPKSDVEKYYNGNILWITPESFLDNNKYLHSSNKFLSEAAFEDGQAKLFERNSLFLVGIGATIGKIGINALDSSCNQQINVIKLKNDCIDFYYYHLLIIKDEIIKFSSFTTLPILNQNKTGMITLAVPIIQEQVNIANYLDIETNKIDSLINKIEKQIELLHEYKQALITSAVTGKIDVRNISNA